MGPDDTDGKPTTLLWADYEVGTVCLIIESATVIEHNGNLVPGVQFKPANAVEFAMAILEKVKDLIERQASDE